MTHKKDMQTCSSISHKLPGNLPSALVTAKTEPVFAENDGRMDAAILFAKQFSARQAAGQSEALAQRKTQFEQAHGAWIAEQNQRFEAHGLWCDDMDAVLSGI